MPGKNVNIDLSGFRKKMAALQGLNDYFNHVTEDAADFFRSKLVAEQLNAPDNVPAFSQVGGRRILRTISGNLKRSFGSNIPGVTTTQTKGGKIRTTIKIVPQRNVAGYGGRVFNIASRKTGRQPMEWTRFYYQKQIKTIATKEFKSAIKIINKKGNYRYRNPYPPVPSS